MRFSLRLYFIEIGIIHIAKNAIKIFSTNIENQRITPINKGKEINKEYLYGIFTKTEFMNIQYAFFVKKFQ